MCDLLRATFIALAVNLLTYLLYRLIWRRWPPLREVWPIMILVWAVLCGLCLTMNACASELPADPCQRVAAKALAGWFGKLPQWRQDAYERFAQGGAVKKVAWITHYWTGEPGVSRTTASGRTVSNEVCAMLDLPFGTYVLLDLPAITTKAGRIVKPAGFNLRRVWDRGSRANRGRAQRRGAQVWVDLWVPRNAPYSVRNATHVRPVYIVEVR